MPIYCAAVEGDPLDSGGDSRVIAGSNNITVVDNNDRFRRVVYIGRSAWCDRCESERIIVPRVFRVTAKRPFSVQSGQPMALGGDQVLCKCSPHPRIVSVYGKRVRLIDKACAEAPIVVFPKLRLPLPPLHMTNSSY